MFKSDNANIEFEVKILDGKNKGKTVVIKTDIEELEEECLSDLLIDAGHLDCYCNDGEYKVLSKRVILSGNIYS